MAKTPLVEAMSAEMFGFCGLLPLKGEESVWFVRGVRPLASEPFLLRAKAFVLWLKIEFVLASELADPTSRSRSPASESGDVPHLSFALFATSVGGECEYVARFRFKEEEGDTSRLRPSTAAPDCDISSRGTSPQHSFQDVRECQL